MGKKPEKPLIEHEKRVDGRGLEEMRNVEIKLDVVSRANGSSMVSLGKTIAIASVYGPRAVHPKHLEEVETGILRSRYNMAPFSVDERKSPGSDRRSIEISKVMKLALEPAIFLEEYPRAVIDVFIEIIQADGSTRVTGINAASLALACAGVPMRDLVTACTTGKVDGKIVLDLCGIEDNFSEADLAFAMLPRKKEISLLQMDGNLTKEEFFHCLKLAEKTCEKIYEIQKNKLRERYLVK
jgi:exosome complex component RRP41